MKVITLCGSTTFKKEFEKVNKELTLQGNVVISVGLFAHADRINLTEEQKQMVDLLHLEKIRMSDEVWVIDVDKYIGESTAREILFAKMLGKEVKYYSQSIFSK